MMLNSLTDPALIRRQRQLWKQYCHKRLEPFLAAVRANPLDSRAHYGVGLLRLLGSDGTKSPLRAALRSTGAGGSDLPNLLIARHKIEK